jgi:hypothetical protein
MFKRQEHVCLVLVQHFQEGRGEKESNWREVTWMYKEPSQCLQHDS